MFSKVFSTSTTIPKTSPPDFQSRLQVSFCRRYELPVVVLVAIPQTCMMTDDVARSQVQRQEVEESVHLLRLEQDLQIHFFAGRMVLQELKDP